MKIILLVLCLCVSNLYAQDCQKILENARKAATDGNYQLAINKYTTAIDCDKNLKNKVSEELSKLFINIARLRDEAVTQKEKAVKAEIAATNSEKATKNALAETEKQKQLATQNLAKANKLVNAFYFAYDRFALAFKDNKFYFIDKNGDKVEKLKEWDKAEQFDDTSGFSRTKTDNGNYLLDTLGNTYKVAYNLKDMDSTIVALDLSATKLDSFPMTILQNNQLEVLILNYNPYNYLEKILSGNLTPNSNDGKLLKSCIEKLKNLKFLKLKGFVIDSLPKALGDLKSLIELNLENSQLKHLPEEVKELKKLKKLNLKKNLLVNLPKELGDLENLIELNLENNQLTNLPEEVKGLKKLEKLNLENNQLTNLPSAIGDLESLIIINLRKNQLISFPIEIAKLKKITELDISNNDSLNIENIRTIFKNYYRKIIILPFFPVYNDDKSILLLKYTSKPISMVEIFYHENLGRPKQTLVLTKKISEIVSLKSLTKINLAEKHLTSLYLYNVGELNNLKELDLSSNYLTTLPVQIGELKNLTELKLEGNQLTSLPAQIGELKNLTTLSLSGNPISEEEQEKIRKLLPNCKIEF